KLSPRRLGISYRSTRPRTISPKCARTLSAWLTPDRVRAHFGEIVRGRVERYEIPNLRGLNFILHDALGGGGSASLKTDAQGKTHGMAMLRMLVEVPDDYAPPAVGPSGPLAPGGEL
ncbi:MAG TPA: hypothetical protein VFB67_01985, partial [Candidatus Polarisedimenticolaceae bacterium]|nr:hypothetical protein [Candidatus Polarisedimenticolaceae bacterium]